MPICRVSRTAETRPAPCAAVAVPLATCAILTALSVSLPSLLRYHLGVELFLGAACLLCLLQSLLSSVLPSLLAYRPFLQPRTTQRRQCCCRQPNKGKWGEEVPARRSVDGARGCPSPSCLEEAQGLSRRVFSCRKRHQPQTSPYLHLLGSAANCCMAFFGSLLFLFCRTLVGRFWAGLHPVLSLPASFRSCFVTSLC